MTRVGKTASFGPFALDLETGELRKDGVRIRLQNQPFQILKKLVEHPGRVVSRDDLRRYLWPEDTFVDFESGLNTAANRLRLALSDSAESPRYVETLPRVGYRFIAPVEIQCESPEPEGTTVVPGLNTTNASPEAATHRPIERNPWFRVALALLLFGLGLVTAIAWTRFYGRHPGPVFTQLTFRKLRVDGAQFAPGGEVVYSAEWNDNPRRLYVMNVLSPESKPLDFGDARLAAISRSSQITFIRAAGKDHVRELAVAPLYGGAPHVIDQGVEYVDDAFNGWMCVVRESPHGLSVEYPRGKTVYQTTHWLGRPRVSPDGKWIAVPEHVLRGDDAGYVTLISKDGKSGRLSPDWASLSGLAWSPNGSEVWFAAASAGINRQLYAVNLQGKVRRVASMPAVLDLFDVAPTGKVLIGRSVPRLSLYLGDVATSQAKDISWLDWSRGVGVSADGNEILFDESGEGGGPLYSVYLYRRDRGTTEHVGPGKAMDVSPDGRWILTSDHAPSSNLTLVSVQDAKTKVLHAPGLTYQAARFAGTSRDIVVQLSKEGNGDELYLQNLDTGSLRPLGASFNYNCLFVSADGLLAAGMASDHETAIVDLRSGRKSLLETPDLSMPVGWANDRKLIVSSNHGLGMRLEKIDVDTHRRQFVADISNPLMANISTEPYFLISSDLKTLLFSRPDAATALFAVDGWS